MRIRVRGPSGMTTLTLDDAITIQQLKDQLSDTTGLPSYTVKLGAPPLPLETVDLDAYPGDTPLKETGLKLANSLLTLSASEASQTKPQSISGSRPSQPSLSDVPVSKKPTPTQSTTLQQPPASSTKQMKQASLQRKPQSTTDDPPEIYLSDWSMTLILRVMPDDNSCLFRALGTCLLTSDLDSADELRDIVASSILSNPETYTDAVLGMKVQDYCRRIKEPDAWGGEIEISILAEYFAVRVDTINVKDGHVYSYNQSASQRCIIVYSGIHYDAIALVAAPGVEVKQFDSSDDGILIKAKEICDILRQRHYYTDTGSFAVKCLVAGCGWKGNGERAAEAHAKEKGHYEFGEEGA